ncbi:MAG: hypothetical protein HGA51_03705 [Demequinaceae bacterium]|nr:hypothetical protein [Demequinaceae bacterium]
MAVNAVELEKFVVGAKLSTYVGGGSTVAPSRAGSHDLTHSVGGWEYRDSYFGGSDFVGQEVVWFEGEPVWAMNYYGWIEEPTLIDAQRAGATIKEALSATYAEGRFLGGFTFDGAHGRYVDQSRGSVAHFKGNEVIEVGGVAAYRLTYAGGLIRS